MLYLAIAKKCVERRENTVAQEAFIQALRDIRSLPATEESVFLLSAAYEQSALDLSTAKAVLAESLKKVQNNNLEILMMSAWARTITLDEVPHSFPLTINRIERKPINLIKPFLTADREWTIATIMGLGKEKVLGPLLVSLAQTVLQEDPMEKGAVAK